MAGAADLDQLAWQLGQRLALQKQMIVTAESCTGGLIARALTERGGSSAWFERGFVTYSNESKIELLGVPPQTLIDHGAVSEHCAAEMALGALRASHADWALSVTGVAGPGGAVPGKPVGMVCFGWVGRTRDVVVETRRFDGERVSVRQAAAIHALRRAEAIWLAGPS
jgi:nicotinamide-nucleotide amidase